MLSSGKQTMFVGAVVQAFQTFAVYMARELEARGGDAVKKGVYSMVLGEDTCNNHVD